MSSSKTHLLDDWLPLAAFARDEANRHPRTVDRWTKEPDGLPFAPYGKGKIIHIPTAREWLFSRMQRPNPRRRPRKGERTANATA